MWEDLIRYTVFRFAGLIQNIFEHQAKALCVDASCWIVSLYLAAMLDLDSAPNQVPLPSKTCSDIFSSFLRIRSPSRNWTQEDMEKAIQAVQSGKLSQRAASRMYNIPQTTIHRRLSGKVRPPFYSAQSRTDAQMCVLTDTESESVKIQVFPKGDNSARTWSDCSTLETEKLTEIDVHKGDSPPWRCSRLVKRKKIIRLSSKKIIKLDSAGTYKFLPLLRGIKWEINPYLIFFMWLCYRHSVVVFLLGEVYCGFTFLRMVGCVSRWKNVSSSTRKWFNVCRVNTVMCRDRSQWMPSYW